MPDSHGTMVELLWQPDDVKIVRHYEFEPATAVLEVDGQDVGAFSSGLCQTSCLITKYEMLHGLFISSSEAPQVSIPNVSCCASY